MNRLFCLWLGLSVIWVVTILAISMLGISISKIAFLVAFLPPVLLLLVGWMVRWMLLRLHGGI